MHRPFYPHNHPYTYFPNFRTQPTIENNCWQNEWNRGWRQGHNQRQFNYPGPNPHYGLGFRNVQLPQQTVGPTHPVVAPERRCPGVTCEICGVRLSSEKVIKQHNNGSRHQRMLRLREESEKQKGIKREEGGQTPNSLMNLEVQPQIDKKSKRDGCVVQHDSTVDKHKEYQKKNTEETSKVPAEKPKGEPMDNTVAQSHGLKREVRGSGGDGYEKRRKRIRKATESSKCDVKALSNFAVSLVQEPAVDKHKGYLKKNAGETSKVPAEKPQGDPRDNTVAQGHGLKCEVRGSRGDENSQKRKRERATESSKPDDNALSDCVESLVQEPVVAAAEGTTKLLEFSSVPAVGSSLEPQEEKSEDRGSSGDEYKKKMKRRRGNPESSNADVNALSDYVESPVQEPAVAPAEGTTALLEFSAVPTVGSSFEPQIQLALQPELEHQGSENTEQYESINPTDQVNILLPSSAAVNLDVPAGSSTNTETADESFKAEEKIDVLTTEKGTDLLSQVNVCLKCGSQGFQETLVYCNKCNTCALHRYCLDGPVIFIEDVTWVCEDCEPVVVERINNEKTRIKPPEESKQQQQIILAKTKDQLYDRDRPDSPNHGLSQCSHECDGENKFNQECQVVQIDAANSSEETVADKNSPSALSDGHNIIELEGHVVAEPIIDPIWRGRFVVCDQSTGTGTVSGLLAHLSSLACCQVLEETRLLPEVLCVDLLQRSAVWPNRFMKSAPNQDNIGLYFFPENERVEKDYDYLVDEIIHTDKAMRVVLEHAELLIFPSTLLQIQCRRFRAKYYLWGVFRAKQTSSNNECGGDDHRSSNNTLEK